MRAGGTVFSMLVLLLLMVVVLRLLLHRHRQRSSSKAWQLKMMHSCWLRGYQGWQHARGASWRGHGVTSWETNKLRIPTTATAARSHHRTSSIHLQRHVGLDVGAAWEVDERNRGGAVRRVVHA